MFTLHLSRHSQFSQNTPCFNSKAQVFTLSSSDSSYNEICYSLNKQTNHLASIYVDLWRFLFTKLICKVSGKELSLYVCKVTFWQDSENQIWLSMLKNTFTVCEQSIKREEGGAWGWGWSLVGGFKSHLHEGQCNMESIF